MHTLLVCLLGSITCCSCSSFSGSGSGSIFLLTAAMISGVISNGFIGSERERFLLGFGDSVGRSFVSFDVPTGLVIP